MRGGGCIAACPGELLASSRSNLARLGELVTSSLSFLVSLGAKKGPKSDPFAHFLLKRHKTLWIARQLVLISSIRLLRIQTFANDRPWMKLGYDNYPYLLIFYWKYRRSKDKDTDFVRVISPPTSH